MNFYTAVAVRVNSPAALELSQRLTAWHDAMVAHERHIAGQTSAGCDEDCPHAEAAALWNEALTTYGQHAHELTFLRARSLEAVA